MMACQYGLWKIAELLMKKAINKSAVDKVTLMKTHSLFINQINCLVVLSMVAMRYLLRLKIIELTALLFY